MCDWQQLIRILTVLIRITKQIQEFLKGFFLLLRYIRRIVRILRDQLKADTNCSFNNVYNANIFERATSLGGDAKTSASSHLRILLLNSVW